MAKRSWTEINSSLLTEFPMEVENFIKKFKMVSFTLFSDFKKLLETGESADVIFSVGGGKYGSVAKIKAHRLILSTRSSVFSAMFRSGMMEPTTGEVEITDIRASSLKLLLEHIYIGVVPINLAEVEDIEDLISAADKYDLQGLKAYLDKNILGGLTPGNAMNIMPKVKALGMNEALATTKEYIRNHLSDVLDAFVEVRTRKLRDQM